MVVQEVVNDHEAVQVSAVQPHFECTKIGSPLSSFLPESAMTFLHLAFVQAALDLDPASSFLPILKSQKKSTFMTFKL